MPKIDHFVAIAEAVANMSKDPSTKVGALAVDDDSNILCVGYNGFPRGVDDAKARYEDKKTKYAMISHAEQNLVAQAARNGIALKGSTVYITSLPPCSSCTKSLIQAGVKHIYFPEPAIGTNALWMEEWNWSRQMLIESGVTYTQYRKD